MEDSSHLNFSFEWLVTMQECSVKSGNSIAALSTNKKRMILPFDLRVIDSLELFGSELRSKWCVEIVDKSIADVLYLIDPRCRNCYYLTGCHFLGC